MPSALKHPAHSKSGRKQRGRKPGTSNRKFGLPVREADKALAMPLLQVDIDKAEKVKTDGVNDPQNFLSCVVAQAATRAWGAERVWIGRRTAYVAFPGDNCAKRYEVDRKARDTLERWDRGEHVVEGVELRLRPPGKKRTRAEMRKTWRKNKQWHQKGTGRKQRSSDPLHNIVRNGNLVRWG